MLAALVIVGILLFMGFGIFGFVVLARMESKQKKAEKNADALLDEMFNGSTDVSVKVHMQGLKYETVIIGAKDRGYRVLSDGTTNGYGTIVFEKA